MDAWLKRFDLLEWKGRKVEELSKGMAQKIQFIGTVLHEPELLLFDEPFSGLDPLSQDELLKAMVELKDSGATVLFSTHVMEHAEKICERILLVNHGRAVVSGTLAEVKASHGRNAVQLEFDGDASFVEALPFVASLTSYPRWCEVELREGTDPDELFRAIAGRLRMRRFEVVAPSLHKVFISLVGQSDASSEENGASHE
jgi:ABC-2 type transport system ATP-binding protein